MEKEEKVDRRKKRFVDNTKEGSGIDFVIFTRAAENRTEVVAPRRSSKLEK